MIAPGPPTAVGPLVGEEVIQGRVGQRLARCISASGEEKPRCLVRKANGPVDISGPCVAKPGCGAIVAQGRDEEANSCRYRYTRHIS